MFTGIVQALGTVVSNVEGNVGRNLGITLSALDTNPVSVGDSIAVNGVCLTVTKLKREIAEFDVSSETAARCRVGDWDIGENVNLETALTLQTPLGGHLLSGHVDGIGNVIHREDEAKFTMMDFEVDRSLGTYIAEKGSVAIDGVSLTVNSIADTKNKTRFEVMLVPHTLSHTTLGERSKGDAVHIEVDQFARYVKRILDAGNNE